MKQRWFSASGDLLLKIEVASQTWKCLPRFGLLGTHQVTDHIAEARQALHARDAAGRGVLWAVCSGAIVTAV
jgi:hypothetical protein